MQAKISYVEACGESDDNSKSNGDQGLYQLTQPKGN